MKRTIERITRAAILAVAFILCATSAWATAPTPTVVWDRNFADNSVVRGEDGHDYTFTLNDVNNTVSDGILKIGSTNKRGALISIGDTTATKVSVLVKYAFAKAPTASEVPVVIYSERGASANSPDVGFVSSGSSNTALWPFWCVTSSNYDYKQFSGVNLNRQSGYILLSYDCSTLKGYVGSSIASLSGFTQSFAWSGTLTHVGLGGPTGKAHNTSGSNADQYPAWNGLLIEKVALFVGEAYSNTDVEEYVFPGEATYYSQWDYANDIITWTTGSSDNKDMGGNATFALFDKSTGLDTATVYTGGNTDPAYGTSTQKFWYNLSYNSDGTSYKAPGLVLRVANNLATLTMGGTFGPLTLGGIIVEPGAYNNNLATYDMNQDPSNSNRSTILGDPTGKTETLFDFNESFAINRGGAFCFPGTVNLNIHTGKSLTLNQAAKVCASITGISNNGIIEDSMINAGGVLKMHGNGTLVPSAGLNASGASLDFSDLGSRVNETPFINGTLTLDGNTTFILPAGTVSPYKVATGISATAYPSFITIGGKKYAATVSAGANAGEIAWEINTATIDVAGDDYALSTIFTDPSSNKDYSLTVTADATLNVGSSTVRAITIDVAEGKTLTLSGTSLTATTIYITGQGAVKASTGGVLVGTVKGDGTIIYTVKPTLGTGNLVATDDAWEGVLWIKGTSVDIAALKPNDSAGVNSTIRLTGCTGYFNNDGALQESTGTLDLQDDGDTKAFTVTNGYTDNGITKFAKLTGSGTFKADTGTAQRYVFLDVSGFDGVLDIPSGKNTRVIFGDSTNNAGNGTLFVASGATVTNKAGKVWTVQGGVRVEGDFTVENTCSMKFTYISGTLNIASGKAVTLTGNTDSLNYGGSGTVNVYGTLNMGTTRWTIGSSNVINLYEDGTISGAGQSTNGALDWYNNPGTLNVYGTSTISANIRCRDNGNLSFNVVSGVCTFSGESYGSQPITKTGAGTLKIAYTGSSTYNLPSVSEGSVEFASGTWNFGSVRSLSGYTMSDGGTAVIKVEQTQPEYGNGETVISNIDESVGSITIVRPDGTSTTVTPSSGTATLSEAVVVSGAACWHAYEMNKSIDDNAHIADGGTGNVKLQLYNATFSDSNFTQEGESDNWYLKYGEKQPYPTSGYSLGTEWTAAIRCTVPTVNKGIVVAFGTQSAGLIGLAAGETAGEVIIVRTTGNSPYTKLATMTVAHPTEAQHVYVFTKTADAVTVYCDGDFINRTAVSFTSPSNFQIGSVHGSMGSTGLVAANSGEMDYLRIYNFAITPKMIAKLAADNPYVSPSGTYTRTVTGNADWVDDDAWTVNYTASTADAPASDAVAMLTANAASTMTVNLSAAALYEELTFDGSPAVRLEAGSGTAKLSAVKVNVDTDVTVAYGAADFSATRVSVADGKTLTFDFSAEPINSQTERQVVVLTGVTAAPEDLSDSSTWPVQVTTHADAASLSTGFLSRFEYDASSSRYVYTYGPDHTIGGEVYYTGGYWSSNSGNTISVTNSYGEATIVFSGDTVVIPSYYPNATTWSDSTLPANVTKIRVSKSNIKVCSGADSGDIFTGVTWTVDSGCVLWFGVDSKTTSLGAMTINGAGTVECGNVTINGAMAGNAPVKIMDNVTTRLTATGSIASTHTISGNASALISCAAVPSAMTFASEWRGTVELPSFAAAGQQLNNYGGTNSKIKINGVTSGYLYWENQNIQPEIVLAGNFSLTDMSKRNYTFSKFSGTGDITFTPATYDLTALTITELAEGYSGTVANNMASTTLNIGTLALESGTSVVGGTKILPTGGTGTISVGAVTVGGEAQSFDLCYESDGVYVAAAEYNSVNYYSVAAAIEEATDAHLEDITLLNGCTTVPTGYLISDGNVVKAVASVTAADDSVTYHASMSDAYSQAGTYGYKYITILVNMSFEPQQTFKYKIADGVTVTPLAASDEYDTPTQNDPDLNGAFTYAFPTKAITYTWGGGAITASWYQPQNWRYGEGTTASRYPTDGDSVVINTPVSITIGGAGASVNGIAIGAAVTLTATTAKTVTATDDGIVLTDSAATLTVSGVTLSPAPTTNVSRSRVVERTTGTYSVELIPGTIFSVY